jgi:hypothetical protein
MAVRKQPAARKTMLMLDMSDLSAAELEAMVARHLTPFGQPTIVRILPPDGQRQYGMVVVQMASPDEARNLASKLGDSEYNGIVIIRLVQPGERAAFAWNGLSRLAANS